MKTHHANSRTKGLKVLLVFGIKADGAAGIHAGEGHLLGGAAVEGLQSDRQGTENKKVIASS